MKLIKIISFLRKGWQREVIQGLQRNIERWKTREHIERAVTYSLRYAAAICSVVVGFFIRFNDFIITFIADAETPRFTFYHE